MQHKKTLEKCRNDENFEIVWKQAENTSETIEKAISDTNFSFVAPSQPRRSSALDAKTHHRVSTYFESLDRVCNEIEQRFNENDQTVLCALYEYLFGNPVDGDIEVISKHYGLDKSLVLSEKNVFSEISKTSNINSASDLISFIREKDLFVVLPFFCKLSIIFATIPATSCSSERSFSALRRIKTYLRSTMCQERLSSLALINIERKYANALNTDKVIDIFGRNKRDMYFF